ncbi:hypothetical protein N7532_009158 [Penicillium argentinense]|uniref:Uncharacterized protein n=1 Tax=Penicillium argentinense TaxID=1131581 RepID=A0A9W9EYY1_9EURO|nr:uncharacterized protein N7532_009158 [Penicillium argentinense]KAJ5090474.1 hypothetical protein N7532_009158 [Penicillium argentinense]
MMRTRGIRLVAFKLQNQFAPLQSSPRILYTAQAQEVGIYQQYSTTGYGDGEGDPHGQDPTAQGVNRRTREIEHPGPSQHKKSNSEPSGQAKDSPRKQSHIQDQLKEQEGSEASKAKSGKQKGSDEQRRAE